MILGTRFLEDLGMKKNLNWKSDDDDDDEVHWCIGGGRGREGGKVAFS